jgi:hypothetical protein
MPRPLIVTGIPRAIEVSSVPPPAIGVATFVRHSYLEPLGLPVTAKPKLLGGTRKALSKLCNGRVGVSSCNGACLNRCRSARYSGKPAPAWDAQLPRQDCNKDGESLGKLSGNGQRKRAVQRAAPGSLGGCDSPRRCAIRIVVAVIEMEVSSEVR